MDVASSKLYKYLSADGADVVENSLIRYTQLGAFNDPFEGRPYVSALDSDDEAKRRFTELFPSGAQKAHAELPREIRSLIAQDVFGQVAAAYYKCIEPELLAQFQGLTPFVEKILHDRFDEHLGALTLSEVPDNVLMWAHYSSSHTGFVIGFDISHRYFHDKRSDADEFRHLRPVQYRDSRPQAPMTALDGIDFFLVKSGDWAYEREWRIFRPFIDAAKRIEQDPYPICLFAYPPACLVEIIFGAKISDLLRDRVVATMRSRPELSHVAFRQARLDNRDYRVRVENVAI